jgi:hypothetical protein
MTEGNIINNVQNELKILKKSSQIVEDLESKLKILREMIFTTFHTTLDSNLINIKSTLSSLFFTLPCN